jgi:hypothetical protein
MYSQLTALTKKYELHLTAGDLVNISGSNNKRKRETRQRKIRNWQRLDDYL